MSGIMVVLGLSTGEWVLIGAASLLGLMIVAFGGVRYWLAMTRPTSLKDVETPTIDRMNAAALSRMTGGGGEDPEPEDEEVPSDVINAIPPEERADAVKKAGSQEA